MKVRITNNSELELNDVKAVFFTVTGSYRVVMKDGTAKTLRPSLLTTEGLQALQEIAASAP